MSETNALAAPLRGIEATAKLLASHAVDDAEGAGKLILEYVAEIRTLCAVRSAETPLPRGRAGRRPDAEGWAPQKRDTAVHAAVATLGGVDVSIRSVVDELAWPAHLTDHKRNDQLVRHSLQRLVKARSLTSRSVVEPGQKWANTLYSLTAVPRARAVGGAA